MAKQNKKYVVVDSVEEYADVFDSEEELQEYFEEYDDDGNDVEDLRVFEFTTEYKVVATKRDFELVEA